MSELIGLYYNNSTIINLLLSHLQNSQKERNPTLGRPNSIAGKVIQTANISFKLNDISIYYVPQHIFRLGIL